MRYIQMLVFLGLYTLLSMVWADEEETKLVGEAIDAIEMCIHWTGEDSEGNEERLKEITDGYLRDCPIAEEKAQAAFTKYPHNVDLAFHIFWLIDIDNFDYTFEMKEQLCQAAKPHQDELNYEGGAYRELCMPADAVAGEDGKNPDCPAQMGSIAIYGYTLKSSQISNQDICTISTYPSDDGHWVVIVYELFRSNYVAWLYDSQSNEQPMMITEERMGNHMFVEWHGNEVFSLIGAGMGYKVNHMYYVGDLTLPRVIKDLLKYYSDIDVYVSLYTDRKENSIYLEIGRVVHNHEEIERYKLDVPNDAMGFAEAIINSVEIYPNELVISYINSDRQEVIKTIKSKIIQENN